MTLKERLKKLEKGVGSEESLQFYVKNICDHVKKECEPIFSILHPSFTIHNIEHSESVISNLDNFCQLMELFDDHNEKKLSKYEIFLLLAAAYLHDIGMIVIKDEEKVRLVKDSDPEFSKDKLSHEIRKDHHIRSAEYIVQNKSIFHISAVDANNIGLICQGHRERNLSQDEYNDLTDPTNRNDPKSVFRTRFLIALLQLADELDVSCERAPEFTRKILLDLSMDRISQFHWMKHYYTNIPKFNDASEARNKKITIEIPLHVPDDLHGKRMKAMLKNRVEDEIKSINQVIKDESGWSFKLKSITININPGLESTPEEVFRAYFVGNHPLKILLIEDDKECQEKLKAALGNDYKIYFVNDEELALEKTKRSYYHLIVLDLHIKDKFENTKEVGYNILENINEFCSNSIVLILSNKVNFHDSKKMKELDIVNYYISKSEFYKDPKNPPSKIIETTTKEYLHLLKKDVDLKIAEADKSNKKLIIDDDSDWQRIMSDALLKAGYDTEIVATGEQALQKLKESDFDLIILDLRIPYSKGREATMRTGLEILKEIGKTSTKIPVITVSAFGTSDVQAVADSVLGGASLFIEKGKISSDLLRNAVAETLEKNIGKLILERFPIPFAFIYREIKSETESLDKFVHLMNLLELFLKFSTMILICDSYKKIEKDEAFLASFKTDISRSSLEDWFGLTKQMLKKTEDFPECILCEKISRIFTKKNKKQISDLVEIRDNWGHGAKRSDYEYKNLAAKCEQSMKNLLSGLKFLTDFRLCSVINLINIKGIYKHKMKDCVGPNPNFVLIERDLKKILPVNEILLFNEKNEKYLSLHPFIILEHCPICGREKIFFFSKFEHRSQKLHYLNYESGHAMSTDKFVEDFKELVGF